MKQRNLAQQEIVETMPETTQQSISLIHATITTPRNKIAAFP